MWGTAPWTPKAGAWTSSHFPGMADGAGAGAAKRKADEGPEELRVRTMYEGLWARILAFETLDIRWIDRSVAAKEDLFSEPHYYRCLLCKTKNNVAKKNRTSEPMGPVPSI